ncbi:MAG: Efflux transporter permease subunit [Cyanobacteriota bacterium erpe_2018_sw_21hr_WHONDRS-SW48-000092_B_bin.40]|jgi:HAE1 family hydrophobic/amphiphilic exporter-1|nr:Efflux transporter permease subunit [Cyanobacteriota bacterium erpe_2018_sw_21hr_WHONDRS-SW48-000092_B_bin.40]
MRPVMTTLLMVALVIFGLIAYITLPVNDLPAVDFPTITVSAGLPGANGETMASAVATPLEKQFSGIAGLESMNSTSATGITSITLQFALNRSIDGAAQDVQAAIVAARPWLPASMPSPPTFRKVNPSDSPILFVALSSKTLPLYTVDEYAENVIAPRLSMTSGVAQVQVMGSQIYAPHIQVDPRKLAAYGIGIDEVAAAVRQANVNLPTGTLHGPDTSYNIRVNGQLFNADAFKPLIIAYRKGAPVRIRDIGTVIDSVQTDKVASWYNGHRGIILTVQRQPGTNTIEIVDDIKKMMPNFRAILPGAVNLEILYDRSISIRRSVGDVKATLVITVFLVVLVIVLALGSLPTTLIASVTLPIVLMGTFAAIKLFGFTLNNISLMALTLSVGFIIDDAIVVLENIVRHIEAGEPPLLAAVNGSREIGFTVVSMTVSLIAVFIPILFLGGIIGRLFFEFAVTISVAILISGFVALSLTPMLCARFLRAGSKQNWLHRISDSLFGHLQAAYDFTLKPALRHKRLVLLSFVLMLVATGYLLKEVPKGFMPTEDTGQIFGMTQAIEGISFTEMVKHQQMLADIVLKNDSIRGAMSSVGASGPNQAVNQGRIFMVLKDRADRPGHASLDQVIQELRKKTANVPGINLFMQNLGGIRIGGQLTKAQYQVTLSGSELQELYKASRDFEAKLKAMPNLQDVNSDLQVKNLQLNVEIDRDKCARLGINVQQVQDALNNAYSARQVSVIYTPTNQYWVILEVEPQYTEDPSMLHWFFVRAGNGQLVPLDTLATVDRGAGPLLVNHLGQFPSVTVSFNLKPGVALSEAVAPVKELVASGLPEDVSGSFQGTAQAFESSTQNLSVLLLISIIVIYIVLGILYESFIHPITILSGLPSAGLGALLTLIIFNMNLDVYGFLGLILLVGIVKKNAIMMIDFAVDVEREQNLKAEAAIYQACLVRFRPIMMTTMAAILGSLPIAIGFGESGGSRQTLGMTIVGGLLVSQLVTLYITPVFYIYLDRFQHFIKDKTVFRLPRKPRLDGPASQLEKYEDAK